ncbi:putative phage abortive infection protein [Uliginosibacterium aquaticum]|uniref:Phage abortive infection protein n=1 Tax=Uliginosibacterium aquaticum TaxID=2731212 RepID=A0ABX2IJ76_9RHOO|nr:putative phage abortive infection protein [Uliginosibacterium aquaticum]NSL55903.1 hypothetical protein [Uliginosibacterium aquaticum]
MRKLIKNYWMLIVPALSSLGILAVYLWEFGTVLGPADGYEKAYSAFGQFGDYFGGVLNPLLAFFNIALIVYYQKSSIAKSADKDIVFRMLDLQSKIVSSFEVRTKHKRKSDGDTQPEHQAKVEPSESEEIEEVNSGLRAFWVFEKEVKTRYQRQKIEISATTQERLAKLHETYSLYYHGFFRKQYLGHYFRNLYHIFKTIDESEAFSREEKYKYAKIVRAQMSHLELKLLYLNCCLDDGIEFKKYVARYEILEWIKDKDFGNYDKNFRKSGVISADINSWEAYPK